MIVEGMRADCNNNPSPVGPIMKFSLQHVEQEILKNAEEAYRQALAAVNGNMDTGTIEQRWQLMCAAGEMIYFLRQAERPEELQPYQDVWDNCFDSLYETIEQSENGEDKGWFTNLAGECGSFATRGMIDKAVAVAKLSQEPGQYNAAENLTNVARFVARHEGFDEAIPIIDEAIAAAKRLPSLFWTEGEIVSAVRLYMEAGRTKEAEGIIASLSANGRLSGLLMTLDVMRENERDRERYPDILKQCEALAAEVKDEFAFLSIAYRYVDCGLFDEGEQLVELKSQELPPHEIVYFRWDLAYALMQNGRREDAEKQLDRVDEWGKGRLIMNILDHTTDTAELRRLIAKAEPLVHVMKPEEHRTGYLFRLAAYKIKVGNETEGRKMMQELLAMSSGDVLMRDSLILNAVGGLAYAAQYDDAVAMIETMESPASKRGAYRTLRSIYVNQEGLETSKKRCRWQPLVKEKKS